MRRFLLATALLFSWCGDASSFSEDPMQPWGADSEFFVPAKAERTPQKNSLSAEACTAMIRFFQVYISPIDGPRSGFLPTSSMYMRHAIQKYGMFKGIALGCDRLMRENKGPWIYPLVQGDPFDRRFDPVR